MNNTEIATLFSGGRFDEAAGHIAETIEWHIYEEKMHIVGKKDVLKFCESVSKYFRSLTTKFETYGMVSDSAKVAIYGAAEFIRDGQTINTVHSCDIYEFNGEGKIIRIYSYCNSAPAK
jgi:hypothetical protein